MEYWQKDIETMNREDLAKLQLERLKKTIEAAGNSPFYSKIFKENGITAERLCPYPFIERHDRKPHGRVAFGQRSGPMG